MSIKGEQAVSYITSLIFMDNSTLRPTTLWQRLLRWPLRALRGVFGGLLALVILFEEWGWVPLQRALAWVGRLPGLRALERRIQTLPPHPALVLFIVPTVLLLPVKLLALWTIGQGQVLLGTLIILGAKVAGTAIVARLFTLTRPALLKLAWFADGYARWLGWKAVLLARVRASWPWRLGRVTKYRLHRRWRRLKQRWT